MTLTLMAVHAHPDDEASSTGGVLAMCSDEGVTTVVVTCTNGEFGDGPAGSKPGDDGHDANEVAQTRLAELRQSCKYLGVTELETLGYHDSGTPDWDYRHGPEAFCNVPLDVVAARISSLIELPAPGPRPCLPGRDRGGRTDAGTREALPDRDAAQPVGVGAAGNAGGR
jgi:LmbE family N-acetylglucosaminyl deacetylase